MPKEFRNLDSTTVDKFIYSQFIKYNQLRSVMNGLLDPSAKIVHVFIDVYELTTILYKFYKYENPLSLTSCIVNAAIHYRNFFRKYNKYSNIFLVYSTNSSFINTKFCPEYNNNNHMSEYNNLEVRALMDRNIDLVKTVVPYLPDIFFRVNSVEPYVVITDMILKFNDHNLNPPTFIISPLPLAFQTVVVCPNTVLFARKKKEGTLYTVTKDSAIYNMMHMIKHRDPYIPLPSEWLSGLFVLMGDQKRNINSLCGTRRAFKILDTIRSNFGTLNPDSIFTEYCNMYKEKGFIRGIKSQEDAYNKIHNRFKCLDIMQQLALYRTLPESRENGFFNQLQDKEELFRINDTYFRDNPMQLDLL